MATTRQELQSEIEQAVNRQLSGDGCPAWSDDVRQKLSQELLRSLTVKAPLTGPQPDVSKLGETLAAFCAVTADGADGHPGDKALRGSINAWRKWSGDRVNLLIHLRALATPVRNLRAKVALGNDDDNDRLARVSVDGFGTVSTFMAKCAQPDRFVDTLDYALPLFVSETQATGEIDGDAFVDWFGKQCRTEPSGLLEFEPNDFRHRQDPVGFLNLGDAAKLSAGAAAPLAEKVHAAENTFVLIGGPPVGTSLRDVAAAFAKKNGKDALDDGDVGALSDVLDKHRYSGEAGAHGYDLDAALDALK